MAVTGKVTPLGKKIFVHNMNFGEQTTQSGIVISSDDGKDRGIYPRWGQVWAVGPEHDEPFNIGDWILIEHARWSRGIDYEYDNGAKTTIRLVDNECIIMWSDVKPSDVFLGKEFNDGDSIDIRPEDFMK